MRVMPGAPGGTCRIGAKTAFDISSALRHAAALDAKLWPIAHRSVDPSDPGWLAKLEARSPLDEAGVRAETEALMDSLLDADASCGDAALRETIRKLMGEHSAFSLATGVALSPETRKGFTATSSACRRSTARRTFAMSPSP